MPYADHLALRNVWVASFVLSLSLLGDALLYVILPVHADAFGVSLAMVGFLLAINRIIRTFAYGFIADLAERIGLKKLCLIAATTAVLSTLGYTLLNGAVWLSLSRVMWGLSYAALLLITLSYAAINPQKTGTRIGLSRSVEQIGPLFAMTVGAWLATLVGPKAVLDIWRLFRVWLYCWPFFCLKRRNQKPLNARQNVTGCFPDQTVSMR